MSRKDHQLHSTWLRMRERCRNPKHNRYHRYGGRGIGICKRWEKFANFVADMGPKPSSDHSLERINNDSDYKPSNCRWATRLEQGSNTIQNKPISVNGEIKHLAEWARIHNISPRAPRHFVKKYGLTEAEYFFLKERGLILNRSSRTRLAVEVFKK